MAVLGAHQRADYVLKGLPWATGIDGDASINGTWGGGNGGWEINVTGTAGNSYLTYPGGWGLPSYGYWLGIVIQNQGGTPGIHEFVKITSTTGTTLSLTKPLVNSYSAQSSCIILKQYQNLTINGNLSAPAWNGTVGGTVWLIANKSINVTGGCISVAGLGFRGGAAVGGTRQTGYCGESSYSGVNAYRQIGAAWDGGGAGAGDTGSGSGAGGAGGGHSGTGESGYTVGSVSGGQGGATGYDTTDGTRMCFGAGGGSGGTDDGDGNASGVGGTAGGRIVLIAPQITLGNYLYAHGGVGGNGAQWSGGGGGGAGGYILLVCEIATLTTNNYAYALGAGRSSGGNGAWGGSAANGKIAIQYRTSVTGTSNPGYVGVQDITLKEDLPAGGYYFTSY